VLFVRNQLCALAQPDLEVTTGNLLLTLINQNIRVGSATPPADPSGDYAWERFKKGESITKDTITMLSGKALQLTGGLDNVKDRTTGTDMGWW